MSARATTTTDSAEPFSGNPLAPLTDQGEPASSGGPRAIDRIWIMERHDEAYPIWRDSGLRRKVLMHVDAHHDMYGKWVEAKHRLVSIANFIYPALEDGIVREVIWVVPDETWATKRGLKDVLRALKRIDPGSAARRVKLQPDGRRITGIVLDKPLTVCPVAHLPAIDEDVLLDIDVDYFVTPNIGYRGIDSYGEIPWCWPADLVAQLRVRCVQSELVTIAYSVEGGYTPLQWKYLGDELALRLQRRSGSEVALRGMAFMHMAALAAQRGEYSAAEEAYGAASQLLPASAAPYYHLAHLSLAVGRPGDGRKSYQKALSLDASYRTAYNSAGFWNYWYDRPQAAAQAHRHTLDLDPEDAYAHLGLGLLAIERKRWQEADAHIRRALALNDQSVDAYRALGRVLCAQGSYDEAIVAYERSLKLVLAGHHRLADDAFVTFLSGDRQPLDSGHGQIHAELARLSARKGATQPAIAGYRMAIAMGEDGVLVRSRLAYLYLRLGQWRRCAGETWQAIRKIPKALDKGRRRLLYRLRYRSRLVWRNLRSLRKPQAGASMWS